MIKFVSSTKYKAEDDGFDGFLVRAELLKSRSNKAGQFCNLVYNQVNGFDPILSVYQFATDNNLVDGRNPYKYFKSNKDIKFDSRKLREEMDKNPELQNVMIETTKPLFEKLLSSTD